MKGFIKISDMQDKLHYLSIDYILKFVPLGEEFDGNTRIYLGGGEKTVTVSTSTTAEEILDMINLAS